MARHRGGGWFLNDSTAVDVFILSSLGRQAHSQPPPVLQGQHRSQWNGFLDVLCSCPTTSGKPGRCKARTEGECSEVFEVHLPLCNLLSGLSNKMIFRDSSLFPIQTDLFCIRILERSRIYRMNIYYIYNTYDIYFIYNIYNTIHSTI